MFKLTEEIKRKLVKDLSREWYFKDCKFEFNGNLLLNNDAKYGISVMEWCDVPIRISYTQLLKSTKCHFKCVRETQEILEKEICNMDYNTLLKKIIALKLEIPPFDGGIIYREQDQVFQFMVHSICSVGSLDGGLNMYITPTMLEKYGVDVETFFHDVKECYMADGIDILSENYKS